MLPGAVLNGTCPCGPHRPLPVLRREGARGGPEPPRPGDDAGSRHGYRVPSSRPPRPWLRAWPRS
jgi:hypothetical protein